MMNSHYINISMVHNFLGRDLVEVGGGGTNLVEHGGNRTVQANEEITSVGDPGIMSVTSYQILNT